MTRFALFFAVIAALAAAVLAALHAPPGALGWTTAVAFGALATAAGAAARGLRAPDDLTEPRHARGPSVPRAGPADVISRGGIFGRMWGVALGAFALFAIVPLVALQRRTTPSAGTWSSGARLVTPDGKPLKADDLIVGAIETVFPEGKIGEPMAATLLLRLQDGLLPVIAGRGDWIPAGNIAYSKICTHAGCPVAIYRQTSYQLYCPCHQSVFDVLNAAQPVSGPATRALPQLPLGVDNDGFLIARADFSSPVGPDEWSRPV